jgi:hypothetical protein
MIDAGLPDIGTLEALAGEAAGVPAGVLGRDIALSMKPAVTPLTISCTIRSLISLDAIDATDVALCGA